MSKSELLIDRPVKSELQIDRLANYDGPKLGKTLRHEVIHHFHALYEKASLLRMMDPRFEKDLERLKLIEPLEVVTKLRLAGIDEELEKEEK